MEWLAAHIWDVVFGLLSFFLTIIWQRAGDKASKSKAELIADATEANR